MIKMNKFILLLSLLCAFCANAYFVSALFGNDIIRNRIIQTAVCAIITIIDYLCIFKLTKLVLNNRTTFRIALSVFVALLGSTLLVGFMDYKLFLFIYGNMFGGLSILIGMGCLLIKGNKSESNSSLSNRIPLLFSAGLFLMPFPVYLITKQLFNRFYSYYIVLTTMTTIGIFMAISIGIISTNKNRKKT
jgi:hypothetical protein